MSSIQTELVAIETNVYVFAIRPEVRRPHCAELVLERLRDLRVHVPLQVYVEIKRNLTPDEMKMFFRSLQLASGLERSFLPAERKRRVYWERHGAKKGDAVIIAQLEAANVGFLVSENRHFLEEVPNLPFEVLSAADALARLDAD